MVTWLGLRCEILIREWMLRLGRESVATGHGGRSAFLDRVWVVFGAGLYYKQVWVGSVAKIGSAQLGCRVSWLLGIRVLSCTVGSRVFREGGSLIASLIMSLGVQLVSEQHLYWGTGDPGSSHHWRNYWLFLFRVTSIIILWVPQQFDNNNKATSVVKLCAWWNFGCPVSRRVVLTRWFLNGSLHLNSHSDQ